MRRKIILLPVLAVMMLGFLGCDKLSGLAPKQSVPKKTIAPAITVKGTIIAKVNNYPLTLEDLNQEIYLPRNKPEDKDPLYVGFFHTGAYQDAISGYGGIKHCLIPSPKHIVVTQDNKGNFDEYIYREEQDVENMLKILGYQVD